MKHSEFARTESRKTCAISHWEASNGCRSLAERLPCGMTSSRGCKNSAWLPQSSWKKDWLLWLLWLVFLCFQSFLLLLLLLLFLHVLLFLLSWTSGLVGLGGQGEPGESQRPDDKQPNNQWTKNRAFVISFLNMEVRVKSEVWQFLNNHKHWIYHHSLMIL